MPFANCPRWTGLTPFPNRCRTSRAAVFWSRARDAACVTWHRSRWLIRVAADGASYEIVADEPVRPTSELPAHLSVHDYLIGAGRLERAVVHTHPIELVAMTHNPEFLGKDVLTRLLWSMIPETRAFCPKGLGIVPYTLPGSQELADRTIALLDDYDVVMWTKHGALAIGTDLIEAFDQIDVLSKSAKIYESARSMGFVPTGMSDAEMQELKEVFGL